jgi:tetratricopeptide (TPR) repeat protein
MQLLSLVAHELDQHPVLIVGTYRDQEAGTAVAPALGGLARLPGTVEIRLSGLDASAVRRFVELTAGRDVDEAVTLSIAGRTSGNPLFVGELTRLLHSERALDPSVVRRAPVPAGVREVIRRRVDRLPAQTVTVLNVAAVLGRRFDLSLLEAVVQLPGDELLEQVESALATGLVAESALVPGSFEFTHDLVRDTLLHDLSGARRGRLHARTAAALVANAASADRARPFEIAHHMLEALPLVPVEDVVPHVIAAADAAASGLAFEEAETGFRRALELVELLPGDARGAHELAIRVRLGRILTITRGHAAEEVGDVIGRAVTLADEREFEADGRQARWAAAVFAGASGDLAAGIELSGKLLAWGQDHSDPAGQCLGHTALGGFHWCRGDLRTAAHHLGAAVDVADAAALDEDPLVAPEIGSGAWARSRHAQLAWLAGRDEEAERLIVDARRRAGGRGKESARVHVECYDAWLGIFRRDLPAAREGAERAVAAADALHYRQYSSLARVLAAAAADEPATRAVELGRAFAEWESTGNRLYVSFFHALHAEAELEIGNVERAAAILERAEGVVRDAGERFYEPEVHRLLAVLALHLGDSDVAASRLERGLDVVRELGLLAFEERLVAAIDASPR